MANDRERFPELKRTPGGSGYQQNTVVLSDFSGVTFEERTRTSPKGDTSVRYSLSIEAEPLLNVLDGIYLGRGPAEAIKAILTKQTHDIVAVVAPATLKFREKMKRAWEGQTKTRSTRRGAPTKSSDAQRARARYSGGRTGDTPPGGKAAVRVGNDSGRLKDGWFVMQNPVEQSFTINAPANRFDPTTWGGTMASLQAWVSRFVSLMPALSDPRTILANEEFAKAVSKAPVVMKLANVPMDKWKDYARVTVAGLRKVIAAAGL